MMRIFLLLFLVSCSSVNQSLNKSTIYKKDIIFSVGNKKFRGVGVVPHSESYSINIEHPNGKIDLFSVMTCHRQYQSENEGSKASYRYAPSAIERESSCPIDLGVYDKKGRHGWGYLLFESNHNKLTARVECNGEVDQANGVSICQSQIGTIQKISFHSNIKAVATEGCDGKLSDNSYEYEMKKNFCYFSFMDNSNNIHDHVSFGYETFVIRE